MTKSQIRKIRYATVVNATGNVALARELRDRSNKYILDLLGLQVGKRAPRIKQYSKATYKRKALEIKKYQYARSKGLDIQLANQLKTTTYENIETYVKYETPTTTPKRIKTKKDLRDERIDNWKTWSSNESYPQFIKDMAEKINLEQGFKKSAHYGYGIAFYAYIENESAKDWADRIEADRFTQSIRYRTMTKRA